MVLVGSQSPSLRPNFQVDFETIRFTEVVEFALSLASSSTKDAFAGLPHLQPYKLIRAWQLAEIGSLKDAVKYDFRSHSYRPIVDIISKQILRGHIFYHQSPVSRVVFFHSDIHRATSRIDCATRWHR